MADDNKIINIEDAKRILEEKIRGADEFEAGLFSNDEELKKMNKAHAFIHSFGGKPVVTSHIYSEVINKEIMEFSTPDSIKIRYANQSVTYGKSQMELGAWWLKHSGRREYQTVIFDPSKPLEYKNCLNLWEGFACDAKKGSWKATKKHIFNILCNRNKVMFKYFMRWLAWCVQNPEKQAEVCVVFKGKEGAGKGFIFTQLCEIFGLHGFTLANRELLTGKHNGHLQRIVFLFADEAYYPGDKEAAGVLKQLITQPTIAIRSMYKDAVMGANRLHIAMSTNNDWVIPAGDDARRYFINAVDNKYAKGKSSDLERKLYFSALWEEMNRGGREAMLHDLLNLKLHGWHPRDDVPNTDELEKQKILNLSILEAAILNILEDGTFPGDFDKERYLTSSNEICEYIEKIEPNARRFSNNKRIELLKALGASKYRKSNKIFWEFPELKIMRANWDRMYIPQRWDSADKWYIQRAAY